MGMFDTFGKHEIQLKIGECLLLEYNVGDTVPILDGIYLGHEGFVVIFNGKLVATFDEKALADKWGTRIELDINKRNPVTLALSALKQEKRNKNNE